MRGILSVFREWEIASMNTIKGIEDGLMQNERAKKERRKMKKCDDERSWGESSLSLIIIYNNAYIYLWIKGIENEEYIEIFVEEIVVLYEWLAWYKEWEYYSC